MAELMLSSLLVVSSLMYMAGTVAIMGRRMFSHDSPVGEGVFVVGSLLFAWGVAGIFVNIISLWWLFVGGLIGIVLLRSTLLKNYGWAGSQFWVSYGILLVVGMVWGSWYMSHIPVSMLTRGLMMMGLPLIVIMLPSSILQLIEQYEILTRIKWKRLHANVQILPGVTQAAPMPMVSLHVPVHCEPSEMVLETLRILAQQDYPNFEVLVVDNNTSDSTLWKPVQEYCLRQGGQFRFFSLVNWPGAKAGALNFALRHTNPRATIIGVIDSDYHARADFLKKLVGYFADPAIGFVQTPHDYRNWRHSLFLRMCYWEYKLFFHTTMVALSERGAGLTVGTMCLIRKAALEEAGGWAEWCVTEDSELAIRIHGLGYESIYLTETFGWGLIPETFAGYKQQRFRWTAGPVQELKYHFSRLWPWSHQKTGEYTLRQRLHHLNHGLDRANLGVGLLFTPFLILLVVVMVANGEVVHVPFSLWLASTILLVTQLCLTTFMYRYIMKASFKDTLGGLWASKALTHVITLASVTTLFSGVVQWQRTDKFKAAFLGWRAFAATRTELLLGFTSFAFAGISFAFLPRTGLVLMLLIGIFYRGGSYLAAPALALIAEWSLLQQKRGKNFSAPGSSKFV